MTHNEFKQWLMDTIQRMQDIIDEPDTTDYIAVRLHDKIVAYKEVVEKFGEVESSIQVKQQADIITGSVVGIIL